VKIGKAVRPGRRIEKKRKDRTGHDRTVKKKSQGGNISPIWGEAPTIPIETKICMAGNLADIITCAKFKDEIFRGYDFTGGQICYFSIDFRIGLTTVQRDCAAFETVQRDCAACDLRTQSKSTLWYEQYAYSKNDFSSHKQAVYPPHNLTHLRKKRGIIITCSTCYSVIGDKPFLWSKAKFDPP